jgi:hypothetical protein
MLNMTISLYFWGRPGTYFKSAVLGVVEAAAVKYEIVVGGK